MSDRVWWTNVRAHVAEGKLYVARDRVDGLRRQPEHAVYDHVTGEVKWVAHPEGGMMSPLFSDVRLRKPYSEQRAVWESADKTLAAV